MREVCGFINTNASDLELMSDSTLQQRLVGYMHCPMGVDQRNIDLMMT